MMLADFTDSLRTSLYRSGHLDPAKAMLGLLARSSIAAQVRYMKWRHEEWFRRARRAA